MTARRQLIVLAATLSALAGAASAQTAPIADAHPQQSKIPEAASLNAAVSARFGEAGAQKAQGMARTSLDARFARDHGASGAFGFLCGRPESFDERAAASPTGSDPHGRFLGARLSLAFR